ncbi:MAG: hypothetical protein RLZ98_620, partial [Pseudomonadota bacterium]
DEIDEKVKEIRDRLAQDGELALDPGNGKG